MMRKAVECCTAAGMQVGISLGSHVITDLDYADDIALLADSEADLQFFVDQVFSFGSTLGRENDAHLFITSENFHLWV